MAESSVSLNYRIEILLKRKKRKKEKKKDLKSRKIVKAFIYLLTQILHLPTFGHSGLSAFFVLPRIIISISTALVYPSS